MDGGGKTLAASGPSAPPLGIDGYRPSAALLKPPCIVSVHSNSSPAQPQALAAAPKVGIVGSQLVGASCSLDDNRWSCREEDCDAEHSELVFGPVPSEVEVTEAITAIQQMFSPVTFSRIFEEGSSSTSSKDAMVKPPSVNGKMHNISSATSTLEDGGPAMELYNTKTIDIQKVIDAFQSLQINPSIQRMVTSLSSDKSVWDAVMKNAAVKELRESFPGVQRTKMRKAGSAPVIVETILDWILQIAKSKILEIFEKIWEIAKDIFIHGDKVKSDAFVASSSSLMSEVFETVRSSFMLSVVVFIVVVVFRLFRAG